jgi:hypothetical protein
MLLIFNMKRLYILTVFLFISLASVAQTFEGGVAAGLVGSQVAGDTYSGFNKAGAYASVWIRLGLSERSSMQTELSFFQKGSRHNPDEKKQDYTFYLMRLNYIEMPFLYQYSFKSAFTIETGLSLSLLLSSYEEYNYMEVTYGDFRLLNPTFVAGFSYPINDRLGAHFRLDSSILSIRTDEVSGARYRLFEHGQFNDCLVLFLSYKL